MPEVGERRVSMVRTAAVVAAVAAGVFVAGTAEAGAWIREPGHFFVKVGADFSSAYAPQNELVSLSQSAMAFSLYAEIGLPYRFDVVVDLPYIIATNEFQAEARYDNHSTGDARLQLERGLFSQLLLTAALELKVPMYRPLSFGSTTVAMQVNGKDKTFSALSFPEVGNGDLELTPKLLYGKSFYPRLAWLTAELGVPVHFATVLHHQAYPAFYAAAGAGAWVWPDHLAFALYGKLFYNPIQEAVMEAANGTDSLYALYFAGSVIITGAPWLPWLKVFGSAGTVLITADRKSGTDFGIGVAVEY